MWLNWNFAHSLWWSLPVTGENFKSKSSAVPEFRRGGLCVFYRPFCKISNTHQTNFFWSLANFVWQISHKEQISDQIYQPNQPTCDFSQIDILVSKIPTKQASELKFCKLSPFVNTYHWSKFQGYSTYQSWNFRGGARVSPWGGS